MEGSGQSQGCLASSSDFHKHIGHLRIMLKWSFGFSSSGVGPGRPISDKVLGDTKAIHLQTTLTPNSRGDGHAGNWDFILSKWQYQDEIVPEIYFREVTYDHF